MITGHFGLAAGVKSFARPVPLWALMLATVWLDIIFVPLLAAHIEHIDPVPGTKGGYGEGIIHADYTHSLLGALIIAGVTGLLAARWWGRRSGAVIGAVVFSHWLLDLTVHRADLPLLPGNLGHLPRVGFGLWKYPWLAASVEAALMIIGTVLYWRSARSTRAPGRRAAVTAAVMGLVGALTLALDLAGI